MHLNRMCKLGIIELLEPRVLPEHPSLITTIIVNARLKTLSHSTRSDDIWVLIATVVAYSKFEPEK